MGNASNLKGRMSNTYLTSPKSEVIKFKIKHILYWEKSKIKSRNPYLSLIRLTNFKYVEANSLSVKHFLIKARNALSDL